MNLTDLEKKVLINIAESEYISVDSIDDLFNYPTWSFVATDSRKDLTGALGSIVKKGLAETDQTETGNDQTCWLTKAGVEALKTFYCYR